MFREIPHGAVGADVVEGFQDGVRGGDVGADGAVEVGDAGQGVVFAGRRGGVGALAGWS